MSYYGGKSAEGINKRITRWIARNLPLLDGYAEPCAGMMSVLVARRPANIEIANDLDGTVTNWWRCIREMPDELAHRCENTPWSRADFEEARATIRAWGNSPKTPSPSDSAPNLQLAWAFYVVVRTSMHHGPNGWGFSVRHKANISTKRVRPPDMLRLADRIRHVHLECRDAEVILQRLADKPNWAIYFDPPYRDADTTPYRVTLTDRARIAELLKAQKGAVAVSGYGDEWDCTGFERTEFHTKMLRATGEALNRTEVVWSNFPPTPAGGLF